MSDFRIDQITNQAGTAGPQIAGITTFSGSSGLVMPSGNTFRRSVLENVVTDGLVLYLDAGNTDSYPESGTIWADLSGYSNNGTLVNGVGFSAEQGGSLVFDGVDDYITLDENSDLANITGDISIEAWFNIDTTNDGNRVIWSKGRTPDPGGGTQTHSLLYVNSSNTITGVIGNLDGSASGVSWGNFHGNQTIATAGQWYHVVLNSDGSNNRIYINGVLGATNARTSAEIYNTNQNGGVRIGSDARYPTTSNRMLDGRIGEVRIYPRALTAAQVSQNYNALKGRYI